MLFYILTICISVVVIGAVNLIINPFLFSMPVYYIILAVIITTIGVIAIDGLFAFIIRRLPKKWFHHTKKIFIVKKREINFYNAIGIKKWKDKVLELGQFTNFTKKKVVDPTNNEYVDRFLLECNYGFIIHLACVVFGFAVIFFYPLKYFYLFGIPVAIVNAFLNILPCFILRYNTPRLMILRRKNERTQMRKMKSENNESSVIQNNTDKVNANDENLNSTQAI